MKILNRGADSAKSDTQELYEALQAERSGVLNHVRELQLATRLLLQAEARRLAQKDATDPRLATLALQQNTLRDRIVVLDTELEVAAIRTPTVSKTDTLIHGRIADDNNRAAGAVTVLLMRADGRPLDGVKPVSVDDSGYYAFVLDATASANLQSGEKLTLALRRGENTVVPAASSGFVLAKGAVAVQDVALSDAELRRLQLRVDFSSATVSAGLRGVAVGAPKAASAKATAAAKAAPAAKGRKKP
jgi:hypothetical protein